MEPKTIPSGSIAASRLQSHEAEIRSCARPAGHASSPGAELGGPNSETEPGIKFMRLGRRVGAHEHALLPVLRQQRQFLLLAGFLIGRDSAGRYDYQHILTVAGSRSGKLVSLIVPNLLFWPALYASFSRLTCHFGEP
jgi:hypothetical protein